MLALEMVTPIAVTGKHKIGGGDPEAEGSGSAAGAATLYNLRLLTEYVVFKS